MENKKIEYGKITTEKVGKLWIAVCFSTYPIEAEVKMTGVSEEIAKLKLVNFLCGLPYKHLDNL